MMSFGSFGKFWYMSRNLEGHMSAEDCALVQGWAHAQEKTWGRSSARASADLGSWHKQKVVVITHTGLLQKTLSVHFKTVDFMVYVSSCGLQASHCGCFSCWRAQALEHMGSVVVVCGLSCPMHVGSSWTRDQNHVPCTGRQIPNHLEPKDHQTSDRGKSTMYDF